MKPHTLKLAQMNFAATGGYRLCYLTCWPRDGPPGGKTQRARGVPGDDAGHRAALLEPDPGCELRGEGPRGRAQSR